MKNGDYHILDANAQYTTRRVPCHETGRNHRHKTHDVDSIQSVCGKTLIRGIDNYRKIYTDDDIGPNYNYQWCQDCVKPLPWTESARKLWLEKHGIATVEPSQLLK